MAVFFHPPLACPPLTPAQQRRGIVVSLADSFIIITGFFTFIAFFALHFTHDLRFAAASVGLVLGLRQVIQQGFNIFGGFVADHIGYRAAIVFGCLIRAIGFGAAGFAQTVPQLLLAAVLMGVGGVFFDAAGSGALACFTTPQNRPGVFALQSTFNNIGAAIGPLLALVLYDRWGFVVVALVAAACFVLAGLQALFYLPDVGLAGSSTTMQVPLTLGETFAAIWRHKTFVRVVVILIGFWMIGQQMSITVPLAGARLAGNNGAAILITVNAFLAIPLQYPLVWLTAKYLSPLVMMAWCTVLTGLGLVMVFLAPDFHWQIAGVALVTIGTILILPVMQTITARIAPPRAVAAFYGFSVLGLGIGGGAGQYIGGRLYDLQAQWNLPWLMAAFSGLVSVVVAWLLWRTPAFGFQPAAIQPKAAQPETSAEFDPARSGVFAAH